MLKVTDDLSVRLTNLTVSCMLLIMLMHLPYAGVQPRFLSGELHFATHLAVPIFFAMSGFFLARRSDAKGWYVSSLRKRFWSLVIPYFAFCTLYAIPLFVHHNILHAGTWQGEGLAFDWYTIKRIYGLTYEFHPACGPFWYVRCLMFFVLLSPFLFAIIRKSKYATLCLLAVSILGVSVLQSTAFGMAHSAEFYSFFSLRGLVFFIGGGALAYWGFALTAKVRLGVAFLGLLAGEILRHYVSFDNLFLSNVTVMVEWLILSFGIFAIMPTWRLPTFVASGSFAMFALHSLCYALWAAVFSRLKLPGGIMMELISLAVLVITAGFCCAIAAALRKFSPALSAIFLGGR